MAHRARRFGRLAKRFDLVSFSAVADWLARTPGALMPDETRREQAYQDLRRSVLLGEFGPPEKPSIAYLPERPGGPPPGKYPLRLTAGQLGYMKAMGADLICDLWAPRPLVAQWFAARQIAAPPWDAAEPQAPADMPKQTKLGRDALPAGVTLSDKPPSTQRAGRSSNHRRTKRDVVGSFIAMKYPGGVLPVDVTAKTIARDFKQEIGITVHVRTIYRALGRK
jgi:hypothetical protein